MSNLTDPPDTPPARQLGEPPAEIVAARRDLERLRIALAEAERRAAELAADREQREAAHAGLVADALLSGRNLPAKPAALSASQAADDATESALVMLADRLRRAEGALHGMTWAWVEADLRRAHDADGAAGRAAVAGLAAAADDLVAACGRETLEAIFPAVVARAIGRHGNARRDRLRWPAEAVAALGLADPVPAYHRELCVAAGWPTVETIQEMTP